MAPPPGPLNLDVEAISGICGSISIAAWVVVFTPQITENFRRGSAEGLSVLFIIAWLLGDLFNILGAVLQGVLPTMLILAIYYTVADIVLLAQCFYYKGFTLRDQVATQVPEHVIESGMLESNERTALLADHFERRERRGSGWSHLSPAIPVLSEAPTNTTPAPSKIRSFLSSFVSIAMICAAGILGWYISRTYSAGKPAAPADELPTLDFWGQVFGWLCATFYLGSRLPQLLLNFRRKSTEGISILFFLFACLGNLTYVLSIFAYDPVCREKTCQPGEAQQIYGRYLLVNASWLAGSLGTLLLDLGIFAQFFIYGQDGVDDEDENEESNMDIDQWDQRPLLERTYH